MNGILEELTKPVWWFSVVVAGIIINVASSYLRAHLDSALGRVSARWRSRSQKKKAAWQAKVEALAFDPEYRQVVRHREIRARVTTIFLLCLAIGLILIATNPPPGLVFPRALLIGLLAFANVAMFGSFIEFVQATNEARAIAEGQRYARQHADDAVRD